MGPYTRETLAEQRAVAAGRPDPDAARRLYEQVGAIYSGVRDTSGEEELADFLATVHEVARTARTPIGEALATAIRRYEHDRTGA